MLPLDVLRVALARMVRFGIEVTPVCPPIIRLKACDPKGLQEGLQPQKHRILTPAKDRRQDLPGAVIDGMPQPPLFLLLAHKAPHVIHFPGRIDGNTRGFGTDSAVSR
jgi:hypothetical protein